MKSAIRTMIALVWLAALGMYVFPPKKKTPSVPADSPPSERTASIVAENEAKDHPDGIAWTASSSATSVGIGGGDITIQAPTSATSYIRTLPAAVGSGIPMDTQKPALPRSDEEDIYAEVENGKHSEASQLMMWALRSDIQYKWVELRWKDPEGKVLLVVRHKKDKPKLP